MFKLPIIYSSVGGNTELVCNAVCQVLQQHSFEAYLQRCQTLKPEEILSSKLIILACPTYGQGTLEADFASFLSQFSSFDLKGKYFAVIGLGDSKYYPEYLTEAAGLLAQWVEKQGGLLICPPLRLGQPPLRFIESLVNRWAEKLVLEMPKLENN